MTRILCKKNPVETDTVFAAKVGQRFVGEFVAPFDDSEVLWIEVECKCDLSVFYFRALCLEYQDFSYPPHDICKSDHTTPLIWNDV